MNNSQFGRPQSGKSLAVAYTDTAGTTAALELGVNVVRVVSTTACFIEIGEAPTAVADTGMYLPANVPEYFNCAAGSAQKVSAIRHTSSGSLYITPF